MFLLSEGHVPCDFSGVYRVFVDMLTYIVVLSSPRQTCLDVDPGDMCFAVGSNVFGDEWRI